VVASAVGGVVGGLLAAPIARRAPGAVYFGLSLVDASCWAVVLTGGSPALMLALLLLAGISESITTAIFYAEVQARLGADRNGRFFAWLMPLSDLMTMAGLAIGGVVVRSGTGLATAVVVALLVLPVLALMRVWLNARLWQRATER
jgi:predicted MFS family arabinose efflux permease